MPVSLSVLKAGPPLLLLKAESALLQGAEIAQEKVMAVKGLQLIGVHGVKGHDAVVFSDPDAMDLWELS